MSNALDVNDSTFEQEVFPYIYELNWDTEPDTVTPLESVCEPVVAVRIAAAETGKEAQTKIIIAIIKANVLFIIFIFITNTTFH